MTSIASSKFNFNLLPTVPLAKRQGPLATAVATHLFGALYQAARILDKGRLLSCRGPVPMRYLGSLRGAVRMEADGNLWLQVPSWIFTR